MRQVIFQNLTDVALGCLGLAFLVLLGTLFLLFRAQKNWSLAQRALLKAQEMRGIWEEEKYRFSQPTLILPEDYYRGYECQK